MSRVSGHFKYFKHILTSKDGPRAERVYLYKASSQIFREMNQNGDIGCRQVITSNILCRDVDQSTHGVVKVTGKEVFSGLPNQSCVDKVTGVCYMIT